MKTIRIPATFGNQIDPVKVEWKTCKTGQNYWKPEKLPKKIEESSRKLVKIHEN